MRKNFSLLILLFAGSVLSVWAAEQFFFDANATVNGHPAVGGKIGWMHYGQENDKIGLIVDINYRNDGFAGGEGGWREQVKKAHAVGLAAGIVFNNMGMSGVVRTSEYMQLRVIRDLRKDWTDAELEVYMEAGFKFSLFFTEQAAFTIGAGLQTMLVPFCYGSLGMVFTL